MCTGTCLHFIPLHFFFRSSEAVKDFGASWKNGQAFLHIIHAFRWVQSSMYKCNVPVSCILLSFKLLSDSFPLN